MLRDILVEIGSVVCAWMELARDISSLSSMEIGDGNAMGSYVVHIKSYQLILRWWFTSSHINSSYGVETLSATIGLWKATESADLMVTTVFRAANHHGEYKTFLFESDEI